MALWLVLGVVGKVLEPTVAGSAMPMLHALGDGDDSAGTHLNGGLAPLLIPATAGDTDEYLHEAMVHVPVVAARGLEGDVYGAAALCVHRSDIAVALEVTGVGGVRFTDRVGRRHLKLVLRQWRVISPYLFGNAEGRPCLRLTGIESRVGDDFADLLSRYAVSLGVLKVMAEREVGEPLRHQTNNGDEGAVVER